MKEAKDAFEKKVSSIEESLLSRVKELEEVVGSDIQSESEVARSKRI